MFAPVSGAGGQVRASGEILKATGLPHNSDASWRNLPAAWADSAEANDAVLRIHGWDAAEDPSGASHGQAWIHVNSSWRAAWR